jgi:hypothetical protein
MPLKRLAVGLAAAFLFSTLGVVMEADAKRWSVTGGGAQTHIGNGLMIPIQAAAGPGTTGTMFPNLRIGVNGQPIVSGTIAKPLLGPTSMGKQGYQRQLKIPIGVLGKAPAKTTVGVRFSNPTVFAVATNLGFKWPAHPAVFTQGNVGATTIAGFGGTITYSNALGSRFGGAASGQITNGDPVAGDLYPTSAVTVFLKINATTPACTHNAFGGTDPGCVAGILFAKPEAAGASGAAIGGDPGMTVATPGAAVVGKNVVVVKLGLTPLGTVVLAAKGATAVLPTNMANSQGGPNTTGQVIIANPAALGGPETFTLSGNDLRTAGGNGTIQLVAGSVSARMASGPNANRGWVRLVLGNFDAADVPSMSLVGMATTVALILLAFGYTMRRRLFS